MNIKHERNWRNLYKTGWGKELVPEAYCHPAKVSRGLARKIYTHAIEQGWLKEGDICLDPFAGIGGLALDAMFHGLHFIGCELEEKFVQLGQRNIDLWNRRYGSGKLRRWGTATILQGDSRRLCEVLEGARAEGIIASPPFADSQQGRRADFVMDSTKVNPTPRRLGDRSYFPAEMESDGQLAALPEGEPPRVDGIVASPPYGQAGLGKVATYKDPEKLEKEIARALAKGGVGSYYGNAPGQLGVMQEGEPPAGIVSSPPWMRGTPGGGKNHFETRPDGTSFGAGRAMMGDYAESRVDLRNELAYMSPEWLERRKETAQNQNLSRLPAEAKDPDYPTFWSATKLILQQCHAVLAPGGYAIFVTKRFVRDKAIVEFSQQWADLCQSCGFELIEWIKAWLVEERGTQYDLEGEAHTKTVKRFSFFRRLHAQKYPHLAIEWEDVLIFRKSTQKGDL